MKKLKDRPKPNDFNINVSDNPNAHQYIQHVMRWFEEFERELKDVLKEEVYGDQVYYRICDSCVMRNSCLEYGLECEALQKLKEILGES